MVKKGSLVRRLSDKRMRQSLGHVTKSHELYPPAGAICMVLESPRKRDLQYQMRHKHQTDNFISLKSAIDVLYEGRVFKHCELAMFEEVKKYDRKDKDS